MSGVTLIVTVGKDGVQTGRLDTYRFEGYKQSQDRPTTLRHGTSTLIDPSPLILLIKFPHPSLISSVFPFSGSGPPSLSLQTHLSGSSSPLEETTHVN